MGRNNGRSIRAPGGMCQHKGSCSSSLYDGWVVLHFFLLIFFIFDYLLLKINMKQCARLSLSLSPKDSRSLPHPITITIVIIVIMIMSIISRVWISVWTREEICVYYSWVKFEFAQVVYRLKFLNRYRHMSDNIRKLTWILGLNSAGSCFEFT